MKRRDRRATPRSRRSGGSRPTERMTDSAAGQRCCRGGSCCNCVPGVFWHRFRSVGETILVHEGIEATGTKEEL